MNLAAKLTPIDFDLALASAIVALAAAELAERDRAELAGVSPVALLAFAGALLPQHQQTARLALRDCALVDLVRVAGWSANDIAQETARYAATAWRQDRNATTAPPRFAGGPRELIWLALKAHPSALSVRRIQQVIENAQCGAKSDPPSGFAPGAR